MSAAPFFGLARKAAQRSRFQSRLNELGFTENSCEQFHQKIANKNLSEIINDLKTENIKPLQLLASFFFKTSEVDEHTNAVMEYVEDSIDFALEIQNNFQQKISEMPLLGLPISVKETFDMKGFATSRGILSLSEKKLENDSFLIQFLKKMGGNIFVRTTVSESCASIMGDNLIIGKSYHPRNFFDKDKSIKTERTPGGSSSGETVLLACGATILGWGSDGAGSIRIPSGFCGLPGLRSTSQRVSAKKESSKEKNTLINTFSAPNCLSVGPITRDVDSLVYVLKLIFGNDEICSLDPYCFPIKFNQDMYESKNKLNIGFLYGKVCSKKIGYLTRSVDEAKKILIDKGHNLISLENDFPDLEEVYNSLMMKITCVDGGNSLTRALSAASVDSSKNIKFILGLPNLAQKCAIFYLSLKDEKKSERIRNLTKKFTAYEYLELIEGELHTFQQECIKVYKKFKLDAIVFPLWECVAELYDTPLEYSGVFTSTTSMLDMPTGSLPVTKVIPSDIETLRKQMNPSNEDERRLLANMGDDSVGLPLNVQVMALPYKDELVLRVMKEIEENLE